MEQYLQEYEHRKREKAYLRKQNKRAVPASSVHNDSLHGNSYHGRRIITPSMIESLDSSGNRQIQDKRGESSADNSANDAAAGDMKTANVEESQSNQETAV